MLKFLHTKEVKSIREIYKYFYDKLTIKGEKFTMKKKTKIIIAALITVVLLVTFSLILIKSYQNKIAKLETEIERLSDPVAVYEEVSKEINIKVINAEIQNVGELVTQEYLYTDAGKFSDPKQIGKINLPFQFTTKSFIAKWDGSIKAGVKMDKITVEVNEAEKEIIVYMPKAEILSHEVDEESFEALDEKDGLFNPIEIDDIKEFETKSKELMEERAIENGILDKAIENAQTIISNLINTDVVEEPGYSITFKIME